MDKALRAFVEAARNLSDQWDNDYPGVYDSYPKYLPSFDEFVEDMQQLVNN